MITQEELEKAKSIIKQYEQEQVRLHRIKDKSCCSKCGTHMSKRWEESACYIKLEIGIDCCSFSALWGENDADRTHPAVKYGSGNQKLIIESERYGDYRLCWKCHREFVRHVGDFLKFQIY